MVDYAALRRKYPKWAHRRDYHAKKRRRSRSRKRRRARRRRLVQSAGTGSTEVLLTQLLHQIMGVTAPVVPQSNKHALNVVSGYTNANKPYPLVPVSSRDWYRKKAGYNIGRPGYGVGVGAAARA